MIDLTKLPNELPKSVADVDNAGIVLCWMISILFDFKFELEETKNILKFKDEGFNLKNLREYTKHHKLYYFDASVNSTIFFAHYNDFLNNNIIGGIIYRGYRKNMTPHVSLLNDFNNGKFMMTYGNPNYTKVKKVHGMYHFFISTKSNISEFVKVKNGELRRYPE